MYSLWSLHIASDENTERGHIDVDYQTEISYEWLSPIFHRELSQSWDFTIPRTPHNESLLLPSNLGVERYPLNDWHTMAYFIGLPWLSDDDAEWGILSVVSTTERRIKVHFLQKNLFFKKIDCPANTVSLHSSNGGIYSSLPAETTRARGEYIVSNEWRYSVAALCVVRLIRAIAKTFLYDENIRDPFGGYLYIVSNILGADIKFNIASNSASEIYEHDGSLESQYWFNREIEKFLSYYYIKSDRNLLKLITELSVLCCIHLIVTDKKPGATTKKNVRGISTYEVSDQRLFFGELSSYHWLQVEYPLVEDMEKTTSTQYPVENRVTLFPLVSYIEGLGINSRGSDPGRKFCFLNHIEDNHSATYEGNAKVYEFYTPFKDNRIANEFYFAKNANTDGDALPTTFRLYTTLHTHFGNHSVEGVSCASSQYRLNYDETYTYLGEYLPTKPVRIRNQRGAKMHPIPLARTNFVGQHISKPFQYITYADTLSLANYISYSRYQSKARCYHLPFKRKGEIRPWHSNSIIHVPNRTLYIKDSFWAHVKEEEELRSKNLEDDFPELPSPPPKRPNNGGKGGGAGKHQDFMRPDDGEMTGFSTSAPPHSGILSVRGDYYPTTMYTRGTNARYNESKELIEYKGDLFTAIGYVYAPLNPPRVCLNVDPYDPTKPRQDKLFLTASQGVYAKSKLVDSIARIGVHYQDSAFEDYFYMTNDVYKELRPVCQRLYKMLSWAVEGPIQSWDEQYVFAHMCEWTYPASGHHTGNQRIKKVSLTLRAGECTIRGVTVVHFNKEATDAEFEEACQ